MRHKRTRHHRFYANRNANPTRHRIHDHMHIIRPISMIRHTMAKRVNRQDSLINILHTRNIRSLRPHLSRNQNHDRSHQIRQPYALETSRSRRTNTIQIRTPTHTYQQPPPHPIRVNSTLTRQSPSPRNTKRTTKNHLHSRQNRSPPSTIYRPNLHINFISRSQRSSTNHRMNKRHRRTPRSSSRINITISRRLTTPIRNHARPTQRYRRVPKEPTKRQRPQGRIRFMPTNQGRSNLRTLDHPRHHSSHIKINPPRHINRIRYKLSIPNHSSTNRSRTRATTR